jgi:hypothetical protein
MVVMGLKGLSGLKRAAEMAGDDFYFKGQESVLKCARGAFQNRL